MKICVTRSNKFSPSETFLRNQVEELRKYGDVFQLYGGFLPEFKENDKLINNRIYWGINKVYKNVLKKENNYFGNHGIIKFLKQNKIDVVLCNYGISGVKLLPICRKLDLPLVVHFHGFDASHKPTLKRYLFQYKEMFQYATIIVVSNDMKNSLMEMGCNENRIHVISCGIDTQKFFYGKNYKKDGTKFISVARFAEKKGTLNTIRAFNEVQRLFPNVTLTLVGPKEESYEKCVKLVDELQISNKVIFTGTLSSSEIITLLQNSDIFVQHSMVASDGDSEGTPNSILEASSCELPVISTFHGGIKEAVVNHKTGFLTEEGDWEAMSRYMIELITKRSERLMMGIEGRAHIKKNYSLNSQIRKLYNVLQRSIRKHKSL